MLRRFDEKWVLVTGAAGGMGRAFANAFAAEGASIALTDIDGAGLQSVAEALRVHGTKCFTHVADLSAESEILRLATVVTEHCPRLDVLINNAGLAYGEIAREFTSLSQAKWLHYFAVNTLAPLRLAEALRAPLAKAMKVFTCDVSSSFADGRIVLPFRSNMAPLCPSRSGETSSGVMPCAYFSGLGVMSPMIHSMARDLSVPSPKKLSRMLVLMRPGFRPKMLACE